MWLLSNSNNRIFVVVFVAWEAWDSNVNLLAGPGFFCIVVYSVLLQSCCPFSFNYQLGPEITQKINFQTHPWGIFLASGRACGGHVDWINWDWKTHSKGGRHHFLGWCHEMFYTKKKNLDEHRHYHSLLADSDCYVMWPQHTPWWTVKLNPFSLKLDLMGILL